MQPYAQAPHYQVPGRKSHGIGAMCSLQGWVLCFAGAARYLHFKDGCSARTSCRKALVAYAPHMGLTGVGALTGDVQVLQVSRCPLPFQCLVRELGFWEDGAGVKWRLPAPDIHTTAAVLQHRGVWMTALQERPPETFCIWLEDMHFSHLVFRLRDQREVATALNAIPKRYRVRPVRSGHLQGRTLHYRHFLRDIDFRAALPAPPSAAANSAPQNPAMAPLASEVEPWWTLASDPDIGPDVISPAQGQGHMPSPDIGPDVISPAQGQGHMP